MLLCLYMYMYMLYLCFYMYVHVHQVFLDYRDLRRPKNSFKAVGTYMYMYVYSFVSKPHPPIKLLHERAWHVHVHVYTCMLRRVQDHYAHA